MKVNISNILKVEGESLNFRVEKNITDVKKFSNVRKFLSPVKVEGTITNNDGVFEIKANGIATVEMECGRCLRGVNLEIPIEVNEDFSITGKEEEAETFLGYTIDLSSVVSRSILIGLPMKVTCDEDCKGLCPICGKDLNEEDCGCNTFNIDPRFESLRSLFKLDEEV